MIVMNCDEIDDDCYEIANYFSTKEKAEEINFKQTLFRKLQRFSDENGGNEIDWKDHFSKKLYIAYQGGELFVDWMSEAKYFGQVYFISREVAQQAIELFHDELIKYFTHDWSQGGELFVDWMSEAKYFGQVYFISREVAQQAIELFHDELIKYFTHDWRVVE